jgi:SHS2 domain-containing protein
MDDLRPLDHTGDVGFEVRAGSLEELFQRAARGLYSILVENPPAVGDREEEVTVEEEGDDLLLRAFLAELLYRFLARRTMFCGFAEVRFEGRRLTARGPCASFDPNRHGLRTELKAVTYHGLEVRRDGDGWTGRVIFDV